MAKQAAQKELHYFYFKTILKNSQSPAY